MKHPVFVDGQEGTTGLRIREVLAERDDVEVLRIDPDKRKDPAERRRLLNRQRNRRQRVGLRSRRRRGQCPQSRRQTCPNESQHPDSLQRARLQMKG